MKQAVKDLTTTPMKESNSKFKPRQGLSKSPIVTSRGADNFSMTPLAVKSRQAKKFYKSPYAPLQKSISRQSLAKMQGKIHKIGHSWSHMNLTQKCSPSLKSRDSEFESTQKQFDYVSLSKAYSEQQQYLRNKIIKVVKSKENLFAKSKNIPKALEEIDKLHKTAISQAESFYSTILNEIKARKTQTLEDLEKSCVEYK